MHSNGVQNTYFCATYQFQFVFVSFILILFLFVLLAHNLISYYYIFRDNFCSRCSNRNALSDKLKLIFMCIVWFRSLVRSFIAHTVSPFIECGFCCFCFYYSVENNILSHSLIISIMKLNLIASFTRVRNYLLTACIFFVLCVSEVKLVSI